MVVHMRAQRSLQEAGVERLLLMGEVYDLPDVVACALVATMAATHVVVGETPDTAETSETGPVTPPADARETAVVFVRERKDRKRSVSG